uniref:UBP-type domain-containing protein n=1 Tax=Panagrolaimus sp. JU765 TaxID=591449 RepID=A0AC34R2D9_9BILA
MSNALPLICNGEQMYAVEMKSECPHLSTIQPMTKDFIQNLDISKNCEKCSSNEENWICLTCYKVSCLNNHVAVHD